jgi:hypothetical protein
MTKRKKKRTAASFHVIAGSGHCGTLWLSTVLNSLPNQTWMHEHRTAVTKLAWQKADRYQPDNPVFSAYWLSVRGMLANSGMDIIGDGKSWAMEHLPAVNNIVSIDRVIYLTQDKEKQLHSLVNRSPVWSRPPYPAVAARRLELYAEISGRPPSVNLLVEANDFMPDWLRSKGLTVDVYSLEDLTTNYETFIELTGLPVDDFDLWRDKNINQKVFA